MPISKTPIPFYTDKMGNKIVPGDLVVYGTKYGTRLARVRGFYTEVKSYGFGAHRREVTRTVMYAQGTWVSRPTSASKSIVRHLSKIMKVSSAFVSLDALVAINK